MVERLGARIADLNKKYPEGNSWQVSPNVVQELFGNRISAADILQLSRQARALNDSNGESAVALLPLLNWIAGTPQGAARSHSKIDGHKLVPSPLVKGAMTSAQTEYTDKVLRPFLVELAEAAVSQLPRKVANFCACWLLLNLDVPASIGDPVLAWLGYPTAVEGAGGRVPSKEKAGDSDRKSSEQEVIDRDVNTDQEVAEREIDSVKKSGCLKSQSGTKTADETQEAQETQKQQETHKTLETEERDGRKNPSQECLEQATSEAGNLQSELAAARLEAIKVEEEANRLRREADEAFKLVAAEAATLQAELGAARAEAANANEPREEKAKQLRSKADEASKKAKQLQAGLEAAKAELAEVKMYGEEMEQSKRLRSEADEPFKHGASQAPRLQAGTSELPGGEAAEPTQTRTSCLKKTAPYDSGGKDGDMSLQASPQDQEVVGSAKNRPSGCLKKAQMPESSESQGQEVVESTKKLPSGCLKKDTHEKRESLESSGQEVIDAAKNAPSGCLKKGSAKTADPTAEEDTAESLPVPVTEKEGLENPILVRTEPDDGVGALPFTRQSSKGDDSDEEVWVPSRVASLREAGPGGSQSGMDFGRTKSGSLAVPGSPAKKTKCRTSFQDQEHEPREAQSSKVPMAAEGNTGPKESAQPCISCGNTLMEDANFCRKCGTKVQGRENTASSKPKVAKKMRGRAVSIFVPPPEVSHDEIVESLKKVPLFKQYTEDDLETLSRVVKIRSWDVDEDIVRHGDFHKELHMVWAGEGRVCVPTLKGLVTKGDYFGDHALVKRHISSQHTISASFTKGEGERFVTLSISQEDYDKLPVQKVKAIADSRKIVRKASNTARRKRRLTPAKAGGEGGEQQIGFDISLLPSKKEAEDRALILQAIQGNLHFMEFLSLSAEQVEMMADMMRLMTAPAGCNVITRGDSGNTFYIVNDGILEVIAADKTDNLALRLRTGDAFGELALLYNCPRKATVRATRNSRLWVLTREEFHSVMRVKSDARIAEYSKLISSVPMFEEHLSKEDKDTLADAVEEAFYAKDEEIIRQGEWGDTFYLVHQGTCNVLIDNVVTGTLERGGYFGELALLNKEPRKATVQVSSDTATFLTLDKHSFNLLLGDVLKAVAEGTGSDVMTKKRSSVGEDMLLKKILADEPTYQRPVSKTICEKSDLDMIGVLGFGAFGIVSLVRHRETQALFAMKALSKGYLKRECLNEHVLSEMRALQIINDPFCVKVHTTYRDPQYVYFLMEPALGGELFELYTARNDFFGSESHARFYTACCARGLNHLHGHKIIYRDLKLENVLLYSNGLACITDMGLAKVCIGKTYTICGTADYFAPETLRQVGHNRAVDWWALGVMIFIMMVGRSPFDAEDTMQIYRNIVKGFKKDFFTPGMNSELKALILALCRKKPEERLPMGPKGIGHLQEHAWFLGREFSAIDDGHWTPPYVPEAPDFDKFAQKLKAGIPAEVEVVENDPTTDNDWDNEFGDLLEFVPSCIPKRSITDDVD